LVAKLKPLNTAKAQYGVRFSLFSGIDDSEPGKFNSILTTGLLALNFDKEANRFLKPG